MARRADHTREELKNMVLDTAWKLVGRDGFEGLTARRIAVEIGYAPGTIYNVFESMDDLHMQINIRTLDALYDVLIGDKCNNASKSAVWNMKAMAKHYAAFAREFRPYWLMLFNQRFSAGWEPPVFYQEKIDRLFDPLENHLHSFFTPKQTRTRKMAARTLWASVHGICFLEQSGKVPVVNGLESSEEMSSFLIDAFIAGISGKQ